VFAPLNRFKSPIVTHGHTFCTNETFDAVAKAIGEFAFVTTELPVALSLEMHCSPSQQRQLAMMMCEHCKGGVLTYEELMSTGRANMLSPIDLKRRILLKGKVKHVLRPEQYVVKRSVSTMLNKLSSFNGPDRSKGSSRSTMGINVKLILGGWRNSATMLSLLGGSASGVSVRGSNAQSSAQPSSRACSLRPSSARGSDMNDMSVLRRMETARERLYQGDSGPKVSNVVDDFYASTLTLRSLAVSAFLGDEPPVWPLPITSINEDRLLTELGLSLAKRNQIEGLHFGRDAMQERMVSGSHHRGGLTEEQLSSRAIAQLAADPPAKAGNLQRRTSSWLLRPFPLGLRFSGKNLSPLPGWLVGAQSIALNMSNNDLAAQLHFALFNGSRGYVLKPLEMRNALVERRGSTKPSTPGHSAQGGLAKVVAGLLRAKSRCGAGVFAGDASKELLGKGSAKAARPLLTPSRDHSQVEEGSRTSGEQAATSSVLPRERRLSFSPAVLAKEQRSASKENVGSGWAFLKGRTLDSNAEPDAAESESSQTHCWPLPCETLHRTSIEMLSLHNLPKRSEQRPRFEGSRGACHTFHPELSGKIVPPDNLDPTCPALTVSLHPIGGLCTISTVLPVPRSVQTEIVVSANVQTDNGMNAPFGRTVHCIAAEPHATFLRVGVMDGKQEVAYEIAVLGRLRCGYRVLMMRSLHGTRIELCCMLVHVSFGIETNLWASSRQLRIMSEKQKEENLRLKRELENLTKKSGHNLVELLRESESPADGHLST